jgi:hypothetical protein
LGKKLGKIVIGLILVQESDGLFKRIGQAYFPKGTENVWAGAERKSLTIM